MQNKFESLAFLTLASNHLPHSRGSPVEDRILERISRSLGVIVTLWGGWSVEGYEAPFEGFVIFRMAHHGVPGTDCFLCWSADNSAIAWGHMLTLDIVKVNLLVSDREPPVPITPWLAVAMSPEGIGAMAQKEGMARAAEVMMELADAERCVAWAMIERSMTP